MVTVYKFKRDNMSKNTKKAFLAAALAALVSVSAGVSACGTTKHPNARITIEFNEKSYVIDYMLYRNMYPQTVQHFIELADAGFYDEIIVHDYKSAEWVSGAYSYNAEFGEGEDRARTDYDVSYSRGAMAEYLEANCKEKEYYSLVTEGIKKGDFTASVYKGSIPDTDSNGNVLLSADYALPTVIGEFSANKHTIENDKGLTASYGSLKMFYYKKDVKSVFVQNGAGQVLYGDYNYNCATSLFSMQVSNSPLYDANNYAVFGQLKNDAAKDALQELTEAISDYITTLGSSLKWSTSASMKVDREDTYAEEGGRDIEVSFTVPSMPLIVRSVKITKH